MKNHKLVDKLKNKISRYNVMDFSISLYQKYCIKTMKMKGFDIMKYYLNKTNFEINFNHLCTTLCRALQEYCRKSTLECLGGDVL